MEWVAQTRPVRVGQLAVALGLSKSTVQRSLTTLEAAGWIERVAGDVTRWAPAPHVRKVLGGRADSDLRVAASAVMRQLSSLTGETVHLSFPVPDHQCIIVDRAETDKTVRTVLPIGTTFDLARSAAGFAILASSTPEGIENSIAAASFSTPGELSKIRVAIQQAIQNGYAERQSDDGDVIAIAAPVLDGSDETVAALVVSVPMSRWTREAKRQVPAATMAAARALEVAV